MPKRRVVGVVSTLAVGGALGLAYMRSLAPRWLETVRLRVALPALPDGWEGVRIAHLSDLHVGGKGVRLDMLWRARRIAEAFVPDIVAITGDFYDQGRPSRDGGLWSDWPASTHVLGVLGNHDLRADDTDLALLLGRLDAAGVRVLRNEAARIALRGSDAWVVGVDDPFTFRADLPRAFSDLPDDADVLMLLAHSPAIATDVPVGRVPLVLTGHTHGGQIRLLPSGRVPFAELLRRWNDEPQRNDPPFYRGIRWTRGSVIIVSHGLGLSELPMRFRTRPQVVLIELARATPDGPACDEVTRYVERLNPARWPAEWFS